MEQLERIFDWLEEQA
ncbi:hypothetical protein CEN46_19890 [Fischerella thermalis CCMEE 5318]|uniref:Uncharacterized protein n=1 Tax=Fischerella thermalis CCMEE 5318 TaxID=2019666 RepID=A0A2N6L9B3_9CYAN|nr:hypothetical protein CEN46_19890 [Fischerella thermalis CCMEE 5318]